MLHHACNGLIIHLNHQFHARIVHGSYSTHAHLSTHAMYLQYYIALVVDDILIIFNLFQLKIGLASNGPYFHSSRSFDDFRILEFWTPSNLAVEQEKKSPRTWLQPPKGLVALSNGETILRQDLLAFKECWFWLFHCNFLWCEKARKIGMES